MLVEFPHIVKARYGGLLLVASVALVSASDAEIRCTATWLLTAILTAPWGYFLPCGMATTEVGLALAAYGEFCEFNNDPVVEFSWNPETVLERKFTV